MGCFLDQTSGNFKSFLMKKKNRHNIKNIEDFYDVFKNEFSSVSDFDSFSPNEIMGIYDSAYTNINDSFVYIYDYKKANYKYISQNIEKVLGIPVEEIQEKSLKILKEIIHPDDYSVCLSVDPLLYNYYLSYGMEKGYDIKTSYDYRLFNRNINKYIRVLQQNMILEFNKRDEIIYSFGLVTDITSCKRSNNTIMKIEGPEENDLKVFVYLPNSDNYKYSISAIELNVLKLFSKGYSTKDISEMLNRSPHTIDTYRKKLQKKTNTHNTTELVSVAISNRLI